MTRDRDLTGAASTLREGAPAGTAPTIRAAGGSDATSLGEAAAIGRIERALFGGDDRLVELGRYEIRDLLGSGAFGKVYRARDPQLDRDVALKVLDAEDDDEHRALLREARVMASLSHPNIAAVYDAGVVEHAGRTRVFIAMELVDGGTLRRWLESERAARAILDILVQVGHGIAAAHAAGIVHRDLKPDNVLVGKDGRARVVDFGLARAHSAVPAAGRGVAASERALGELTGMLVGTPAYMAPEQLDGEPADPMTDQFAFCVTAWESLYGERPFGGATIGELRAAIARGVGVPRRARHGGGIPRRIHRALVRGLSAARTGRFPAMDPLLVELELARPAWVVPAGLAVTAGIGLAVGAIVMRSTSPASSSDDAACPRPIAELAGVWDVARRDEIERAFARTSVPFRADTFARVAARIDQLTGAWLDAHRDACLATAVRRDQSPDMLDRRMACLRDWRRQLRALADGFAIASDPTVVGAVRALETLPPISACADRDALAATPGWPVDADKRARLEALFEKLARARGAQVLGTAAQVAVATLLDEVSADPLTATYPPLAIALELVRADIATSAGRHDEARRAARDALDHAMASSDRRSVASAATALVTLGAFDTRRKDDALQWVKTATAAIANLEDDHDAAARLALAEGNVQMASADAVAAESAFTRALAELRAMGNSGPLASTALALLGTSELGRGKLDAAERHVREALIVAEGALGPAHPDVAGIVSRQALVLAARGELVAALAADARAIDILRATYGADHLGLLFARGSRAQHALMHGDLATAEQELVEAMRIGARAYPAEHPMLAQLALARAEVLVRSGRADEAKPLAVAARDAVARIADERDLGLAYADAVLARVEARMGARDAAIAHARGAVARCEAYPAGMPSGPCGMIHHALGDIAVEHEERLGALEAAERAFVNGTPEPVRLAEVRFALAKERWRTDRDAALALARQVVRELPRDADPSLRSAIDQWLAQPR